VLGFDSRGGGSPGTEAPGRGPTPRRRPERAGGGTMRRCHGAAAIATDLAARGESRKLPDGPGRGGRDRARPSRDYPLFPVPWMASRLRPGLTPGRGSRRHTGDRGPPGDRPPARGRGRFRPAGSALIDRTPGAWTIPAVWAGGRVQDPAGRGSRSFARAPVRGPHTPPEGGTAGGWAGSLVPPCSGTAARAAPASPARMHLRRRPGRAGGGEGQDEQRREERAWQPSSPRWSPATSSR